MTEGLHLIEEEAEDLDSFARTFAVIETFGPTVEGEGHLAGMPTLFVRFGGCDYRCSWCDSLYAVEPELVREHARKLTADEIVAELQALCPHPMWVTLSGGNPALQRVGNFVAQMQMLRYKIAVETQGSAWRAWLANVDHLTVSPKPPSSGMVNEVNAHVTAAFFKQAEKMPEDQRSLKIVVFDQADLDWAKSFMLERREAGGEWESFLSVGTDPPDPGETMDVTLARISDRYRWLCEATAGDPMLTDVRVLPQLHVISWGHARAV